MSILNALLIIGECFFGATLILAAGFLLTRGGAAAQRHLIWSGAFAALLALPVFALLVPPQVVFELAAAPMPATTVAAAPAPSGFDIADAILLAVAVWFAGLTFLLGKLAAGWCGLMLLKRRSVPHIPQGIDPRKFAGAPRWQVRLRTVPGEMGAMTWGSVVLLPKTSVRWPRERLEAVLLHEFAHVRRRDSLARLVAALACALYWPNPFVWSAARRMRCDAEIAADDAVLSAGVRPSAYAEQLLGLAGANAPFAGVSLAMAEPSTLKTRVECVLSANRSRCGVTKMDVLKTTLLGVAAVSALALARPSLAEANQPAVPAAVNVDAQGRVASADDRGNEPVIELKDAPQPDIVLVSAGDPPPAPPPAVDLVPPAPPTLDLVPPPPVAPVAPVPPIPPRNACRGPQCADDAHIRETVERAMANARVALADARRVNTEALRQAREELRAHQGEIRRAAQEARRVNAEAIRQAIADAHIEETVKRAMAEAGPEIERALAEARQALDKAAHEAAPQERDTDRETDD